MRWLTPLISIAVVLLLATLSGPPAAPPRAPSALSLALSPRADPPHRTDGVARPDLPLIASANTTGVAWSTIGFDLHHTGDNSQEFTVGPTNVSELAPRWTYSTPGGVTSSIAVVNGTAYFGDWNGSLYAVNAYTGDLEWRADLGGPYDYPDCGQPGIAATPTVWNNTVYVGGSNPEEYALNASTGAILWHLDLANYTGSSSPWTAYKAWSSALVVNGYLYVGTSSGCDNPLVRAALLQVSLITHQIVHIAYTIPTGDLGDSIWSSPSYDAATNTVWVTTGNGLSDLEQYARCIMAFNATNVTDVIGYAQEAIPHQDYDFGDGVTIFHNAEGAPMVVALNKNGFAYAFNLTTFRGNRSADPKWTLEIATYPGSSYSPPAFDGSTLYFGSDNTTSPNGTDVSGSIRAVYPGNGTTKWFVALPYSVFGGLTYANGLVYAGLTGGFDDQSHGGLVVLNASTGAILYDRPGPATWGEPVVVNGEVLYSEGNLSSSKGGGVMALALPFRGSYSSTPLLGYPETTYTLRALPTGGVVPYNYTWTFGDGQVSFAGVVLHGYAAAGTYGVNLTVRDAVGQVVEERFTLGANPPLAASGSVGRDPIPSLGTSWLNLTVAGAMPPYRFQWVGLPAGMPPPDTTAQDVLFQAPFAGVFNVSANITSASLQALTVRFPTLDVDGPTAISILAHPGTFDVKVNVSFSVDFGETGMAANYSWRFGDGNSSTLASPFHDYTQPGTYSVTVSVVYTGGSRAQASATFVVSPAPVDILGEFAIMAGIGAGAIAACYFVLRRKPGPP